MIKSVGSLLLLLLFICIQSVFARSLVQCDAHSGGVKIGWQRKPMKPGDPQKSIFDFTKNKQSIFITTATIYGTKATKYEFNLAVEDISSTIGGLWHLKDKEGTTMVDCDEMQTAINTALSDDSIIAIQIGPNMIKGHVMPEEEQTVTIREEGKSRKGIRFKFKDIDGKPRSIRFSLGTMDEKVFIDTTIYAFIKPPSGDIKWTIHDVRRTKKKKGASIGTDELRNRINNILQKKQPMKIQIGLYTVQDIKVTVSSIHKAVSPIHKAALETIEPPVPGIISPLEVTEFSDFMVFKFRDILGVGRTVEFDVRNTDCVTIGHVSYKCIQAEGQRIRWQGVGEVSTEVLLDEMREKQGTSITIQIGEYILQGAAIPVTSELIPVDVAEAMRKVEEIWNEEWKISDDKKIRKQQEQHLEGIFNSWKEATYGRGWIARHPEVHDLGSVFLDIGVNLVVGGVVGGAVTMGVAGGKYAFGTGPVNAVCETFGGYAADKFGERFKFGDKIKNPTLKMFWDTVGKSTMSGATSGAGMGMAWGNAAGFAIGFVFPPSWLAAIPGGTAGGFVIGGITGGVVGFIYGVAEGTIKGLIMGPKKRKKLATVAAKYEHETDIDRLFMFEKLPIEYQKKLLFTLDAIRIQQGQYFSEEEKTKMREHHLRAKMFVYKSKFREPKPIVIDSSKPRTIKQTIESTMSLISDDPSVEYDGEPVLPIVTDIFKDLPDGHPRLRRYRTRHPHVTKLETEESFIPIPSAMEVSYHKSKIHEIAQATGHPLYVSVPDLDIDKQYKELFDPKKIYTYVGPSSTHYVSETKSGKFRYLEIPHRVLPDGSVDTSRPHHTPETLTRKSKEPPKLKYMDHKFKQLEPPPKLKLKTSNSYYSFQDFNAMNNDATDKYGNGFRTYLYAMIAALIFVVCGCCLLWFFTTAITAYVAYSIGKWTHKMSGDKNNNSINNYEYVSEV